VDKAGSDVGEEPPELDKSTVDERLIFSFARRCSRYVHHQHLVTTVCLVKKGAVGEPVRDQCCLATAFIPCDDQRLILDLLLI
jgi:hypothetical protein